MGAAFQVILADGQPAGRLYVARWPNEIRIVDITLLPEYRNSGIGTRLLKGLMAEARRAQKVLSIHVELFNPALRLYTRLGFVKTGEHGVYYRMDWTPLPGGLRLSEDHLIPHSLGIPANRHDEHLERPQRRMN